MIATTMQMLDRLSGAGQSALELYGIRNAYSGPGLAYKAGISLRYAGLPPSSAAINRAIVDAVLSGRLKAGARLGEQVLATLFSVSRTTVREALIRLEARGIVQVSPRKGWFVVEPSLDEAQEAFQARRAIEVGILRTIDAVPEPMIAALRHHIELERHAIAEDDAAARSYLLGDFHVCMVEALGNRTLADILRDLTARTVLISALYQSTHDATESCDEHQFIVDALAGGDIAAASALMVEHIGHVEAGLKKRIEPDPMLDLGRALRLAPAAPHENAGRKPRE